MHADLILTGGRVFRGLREGFAEAIAISADRVMAVGAAADVAGLRGPGTRIVDLAGRAAIPGLIDAHMHLLNVGLSMAELRLAADDGVRSIDELLARVRARAATTPAGAFVKGRGYDHDALAERRHPTREELDAAAPRHPVFIERTCGHVAVANSAALALAGITARTPDPEGGHIERRDGALTGLLAERATRAILACLPRPDRQDLVAGIERAGRALLAQGVTGTMDAAIGMHFGFAEVEAFEAAATTGKLPLRLWACLFGDPGGGVIERAHAEGLRFGRRNGMLRYGAAKIFTDGSAGALTAAMGEPYLAGAPGNRGILCFSDADAYDLLARYHALGYQLAIHAIGDAAIEQVLSGMERAGTPDRPIAGRRHRIEHCGFPDAGQLARMRAAGIAPAPQPVFIYEFGDLYVTNLGAERANASYPMRDWMDAGMLPSASTDAPVCATDPFRNLYTMTTRRTRRGTTIGGAQRLSLAEALHAYTHCSAWSQFMEEETGRLLPGMKADVAVLSANVFDAPLDQLREDTRCDLTILDGRVVHDRHGET